MEIDIYTSTRRWWLLLSTGLASTRVSFLHRRHFLLKQFMSLRALTSVSVLEPGLRPPPPPISFDDAQNHCAVLRLSRPTGPGLVVTEIPNQKRNVFRRRCRTIMYTDRPPPHSISGHTTSISPPPPDPSASHRTFASSRLPANLDFILR